MTLIERIVQEKRAEVATVKSRHDVAYLKAMIKDAPPVRSFAKALTNDFGLIAELKRRSPSVDNMRKENVEQAIDAYQESRIVRAISVLTEGNFFGGSLKDLLAAKEKVSKPVLRKDFIFSDYQIYEARAYGADAVLLMASVIKTRPELEALYKTAQELNLSVVFEAHDESEIKRIPQGAQICGLNSRKFKVADANPGLIRGLLNKFGAGVVKRDITTDLAVFELVDKLQKYHKKAIKVAESGVSHTQIEAVRAKGFQAALVGTSLLRDPEGVQVALKRFEDALETGKATVSARTSAPLTA